ncbi:MULTISPECIES: hypothetical protein [unclassified Sporolactobacillus]|uniref:hypothetical protein n=1 Tax=unclassified Sporolactobacillus TaxID=2628533 RepID=UPI002368D53F|nr:hypothetical protein [Sporolactobacillus sp. CQH2019]MDD9148736.1 hypothetical protein [Sporolactobacillus sp. CQH2019]
MSGLRTVEACKGLSAQALDYKMDYLLMELEHLDNKLVRKTEEMIGEQFGSCRRELFRIGSEIAHINRSVNRLEKNLDTFSKTAAGTALPESSIEVPQ